MVYSLPCPYPEKRKKGKKKKRKRENIPCSQWCRMLAWGNRVKKTYRLSRKEEMTNRNWRERRALCHHIEGFTFDWGQLCNTRLWKSNQVQFFLSFLLQWSLDSVHAETLLQIPASLFSYHWDRNRSCSNSTTRTGWLSSQRASVTKSQFSGVEKLKKKKYCELFLYSYHEKLFKFYSLFSFSFFFCQPLPMSINHSISLC